MDSGHMDRPNDLPAQLTEQQTEAIVHRGAPLLIIAGPGSGKTEVITWRVAHLIRSSQVAPAHCLVTTFTNKAALELKDRIQQKLPDLDVEQMPVGTLHSLCADILRDYQSLSPLPRGFRILDETGRFLFVYSHRKQLGLDARLKGRPHDFFSDVLRMFDLATEELVAPDRLATWCQQQHQAAEQRAEEAAKGKSKTKAQKAADEVELWAEEGLIVGSYQAYCELLQASNLVDFAFLQRHALDLLDTHTEVVIELRERYREILIDEYQDTNAAQERLIQHLAGNGEHLTVVGDDDQSVYRFRGATVQNILTFEQRYPGAHVVKLAQNFRSKAPIVQHSQSVITHNEPARFAKDLFTMRAGGSDILLVYEHAVAEEAEAIATLLNDLKYSGKIRRWSDVALLLRSVKSYAKDYVAALIAEGIPCYVLGDATFFEHDYIEEVYNLFHFLGASKPWGDIHVRAPIMRWTDSTQAALQAYSGNLLDITDDDGLKQIGVAEAADRFRLLSLLTLKRRVQAKEHHSLLEVFYALMEITGYIQECERVGKEEHLLNLGTLSRLVAAFDEYGGTRNFYPFQDYLQLMKEGGIDSAVVAPEDAVQIMTIHQAKGLEFPVVVVGSVMDGRLPATRRRDRYPVPHELRASGQPEVEDVHLVDERKLFYVAATRARDLLILGTADVVNKRGGGPSPFLTEMLGDDLKTAADYTHAYVEAAESQARASQQPRERVSFSQLAYFLQCPMRYKLAVLYGFEIPKPDPVDFGANVHRALKAIHDRVRSGRAPQPSDVDEIIERTWIPAPEADPQQDRQAKKAAAGQLKRYLSQPANRFADVMRAEASFSFGLDQHVLVGKIDLLRHAGEGVEIVDFKTGRLATAQREQIDTQLDVYALGAEVSLGLPITRLTAHFLEDGEIYTRDWSSQHAESARTRLSGVLGQIMRREFPPRSELLSAVQRLSPHMPVCRTTQRGQR